MNNAQRILLAVYLPLTLLILRFDQLYPGEAAVQYLKYTVMTALFIAVSSIRKKHWEQKLMAVSFLFLVIADFFLVFAATIENLKLDLTPLGIGGFLIAYLFLIAAYQRNFKLGKAEIITAIPVSGTFIYVFLSLKPFVVGPMLVGTLIFGIVLSYMTWSAVCTLFRHYYRPAIAGLIALSGILMFICDLGVAYSLFHPLYAGGHVSWLKNIIWGAYIPGWTLLAVVICAEDLRMPLGTKISL